MHTEADCADDSAVLSIPNNVVISSAVTTGNCGAPTGRPTVHLLFATCTTVPVKLSSPIATPVRSDGTSMGDTSGAAPGSAHANSPWRLSIAGAIALPLKRHGLKSASQKTSNT
ncbi:MAG: hypothetical protein WC359_13165 [Dehalococcoidia bacterium]